MDIQMKDIDPSMCTHTNSLQISQFLDLVKCFKTFGAYYNILLLNLLNQQCLVESDLKLKV